MFLADLEKAERPAILVGGGAYAARESIIAFARKLHIPCFRTWNAQDVITDDLPIYAGTVGTYGGPGRNFGIQNCDLLLALGCRMSGRITGGQPETFARGAKKYIVNVDPDPSAGQVDGIVIQSTCEAFMERLVGWPEFPFFKWMEQCREWLKYDPVKPQPFFTHYQFMRRLSELMPSNAIVISDTGGNVIMMGHCFKSKQGQRIFTSNGNTPMGFAMCGAIGAWFADPTRPVVCIIGDGGMAMNTQELNTLRNYGIPLKIFIINNGILGNTASYQRVNGMQNVACAAPDYVPPDFRAIAYAYGIECCTLQTKKHMEEMIPYVLSSTEPIVCDVIHEDFCQYEPRLSVWQGGIEEMFPPLPKDEFLKNMLIAPIDGWEQRRETMK